MKKVQQLFNNVRRGLSSLGGGKLSPAVLAARAGRVSDDGSFMEQLEKREYLFVLTVDDADPTFQADPNRPHYGTVTANFAYFLPFLTGQLPTITSGTVTAGGVGDQTSPGPGRTLGPADAQTFDVLAVARNRMSEWLEARMAGVQLTLYGRFEDDPNTVEVELPTSLQVFDFYGRDMQQRLDIGRPSPFAQNLGAQAGAIPGTINISAAPDGGRPASGPPGNATVLPSVLHNQVNVDDVEAIGDRGNATGAFLAANRFNRNGLAANIGDGVPDMNDGLGMIVFIQSDANTQLGMVSGQTVRITDQASFDRSDIFDQDAFYGIDIPEDLAGLTDWWDSQGVGFGIIPNTNPPDVSGLPEIGGSVLFGAPYVRDNTDRNTYFGVDTNTDVAAQTFAALPADPLVLNFTSQALATGPITVDGVVLNSPIMGIRTLRADQAVGSINVPGIMMGTVTISGSLGLFFAQHMLGSMNVTGDVGQVYVGGTSGYWVREDQRGDTNGLDNLRGTGSAFNIGGRLGTLSIAGRNRANVFVVGDTTNPRQRIEGSTYSEVETIFGIDPATPEEQIAPTINTGIIRSGIGMYRNDGFSTAEFIFSGLSGTTISGSLGLIDPLNEEDLADFYGFAADAGRTVQFNVIYPNPLAAQNAGQAYVRVYDQNGNLVATHQGAGATPADTTNPTQPRTGVNFQFQAPSTGVYYLVIGTPADGNFQSSLQYTITMAGQAATTLGQMITGGGIGASTIQVTGGSVGRISGGQGVIGGDGAVLRAESDASGIPDADYFDSAGFNINVPTMYNFLVGADVGGGLITSSGVVGGIQIGGGVMGLSLNVARQLGTFDVGGQTGVQEVTNLSRTAGQTGAVLVRTGSNSVPGNIGRLRFGDIVRGDQFTLQTSAGSFVDVMEVLQGGFTNTQPTFNLGQGSDIRFASFPSIDIRNPGQQVLTDFFLPLTANTPLTFTDDSGVTFTIQVTGTGSFGTLRYAPAGPFGGGVVGRIDVTLGNLGTLRIATTSAGSLALGEVNVTSPGSPSNSIFFSGPAEIDVRSLTVNGAITDLSNTTPDGDLVSVDATSVRRVSVYGSVGATRTYMLSMDDVATRVNLTQDLSPAVGSPIGIPANLINAWTGDIDVPYVWDAAADEDRTLEDSGSPIDHILNGIVIRTGNVDSVTARGSIGDVITQGGNGGTGDGGRVTSITANNDRVNTTGRFEGITGSIFVGEVTTLDVGDGILGPGPTPLARAGVFAIDDIITISAGTRVLNPTLTGAVIVAGNANAAEAGNAQGLQADNAQGIGTLSIRGANLDRSFIHVANLDSWWRSARYGGDDVARSGNITSIAVTNGNVSRTDIQALGITSITITGGVWDSSSAQATTTIGLVAADAFTSSLSNRDPLQYYFNQIRAGLDLTTLRVNNAAVGDIEDLFVSAGRNNTVITAHNIVRSNINVRGNAGTITVRGDVRASTIGSGRLASMAVTGDIRSSTVRISGAILSLTAGGDIADAEIVSSGPDGRITTLTAGGTMTGSVTSSGPIGTIRTTRGDIDLTISTTDGVDGNITTVASGRDLVLRLDMADGTSVSTLTAARHIGRRLVDGSTPDELDIPGNVTTITAGGVLYSDVRAGGTVGTITSGRALAYLPTADYATDAVITASGRITTVNINGDFNGSVVSYSGGIGAVTITNGSFRAGTAQRPNRIQANDGDITSVRIVSGHLLGDILAPQGSITTVSVTGGAVFGDIGVNPSLSTAVQTTPLTERRTQLPPGAAPGNGPIIAAGINIGTITTTGGLFEASISAGRTITSITVGRGVDNQGAVTAVPTFIVAGDRVATLTVTQQARGTFVGSGITDLGDDNRPGGVGADADSNKSGTIGTTTFRGGTDGVTVAAGLVAGVDGAFNTADDQVAPGISTITSVQVLGVAANTVVRTDSGVPAVSANLNGGTNSVGGQALPVSDGFAYSAAIPGVNVPVTAAGIIVTIGGQLRRVVFTGAGTAVYSAALNTGPGPGSIVLTGTTAGSTMRVEAAPVGAVSIGNLAAIVGRDDASLGSLTETADVSTLTTTLDGSITTVSTRNLTNSPIRTGQSLGTVTAGVAGGSTQLTVESRGEIGTVRTLGGVQAGLVPSSIRGLSIGTLNIGGAFAGSVSSDRNITTTTVTGQLANGSGIRAGYDMGATTIGSMSNATVAAGGNVTSVRVNGSVTDSAILSGVDLGRDAAFGGTGVNADDVTNGNMGAVTITGSFIRSDIGAGVYQGEDGFLGTQDDLLGEGRSTLGAVNITGSAQGSLLNTESYRIMSNGSLSTVRAQNLPFTAAQNLLVVTNKAAPDALAVTNVDVQFIGGVYFATITFNQPVSPSTLSGALSISEIWGAEPIGTIIPLVENTDYTVTYSAGSTSAVVQFSTDVTNRDLDTGGPVPFPGALASPGTYRFTISSAIRGQTDATLLDGNGNGVAETVDPWSSDFVIGDAGDRFLPNVGQTADLANVDFYGPINLDVIMSANATAVPDTADINTTYSIQGFLGDHPDANGTFFQPGGDADVYQITMRAGQVLSTGLTGSQGSVSIVAWEIGNPADPTDDALIDLTQAGNGITSVLSDGTVLMLEDRQVFLVVLSVDPTDPFMQPPGPGQPPAIIGDPAGGPATVVNLPGSAANGAYTLNVRIVDDGDNGFAGGTPSSDGSIIETAPLPSAFAGVDNILGTQDDIAAINVGEYTYRLDPGANNVFNGNGTATVRSDDRVVGVNPYNTEQVTTAGTDGRFGTADDLVSINSAIGERGAVGGTLVNATDLDVFQLNAGSAIAAGQRYRFTLRVSEFGGDLGTLRTPRPTQGGGVGVAGGDNRGEAQFALFETTPAGGINQGALVAQAPNPEAYRGTANTVVATDGSTTYGYDANGDFYMEITIPPSQTAAAPFGGGGPANGTFALYVQGAHQSNYTVEVLNVGTGPAATAQTQNFLIETNGGVVNWLEAFGSTTLDRYSGSVNANVPGLGQPTRAYILANLVANLNSIFTAAGVDVVISTTSNSFVGQSFSTVFVTDSLDPADQINQNFFGVSERRDVLNANRNDQAVVFAPAVTALGNTVDQAGIDSYTRSLTAAVAQRMGELLGLTFANGGSMANGIPAAAGALTVPDLEYNAADTRLSQVLRSNFILGVQSDTQLLRRIFQLTT